MSVAGDFAQCTDLVGVFCPFEAVYKSQTGEKRDGSEDAETAVDQTPERRDATERPGDQSEWNDRDAGDYAELENPLVADGVAQWADERDCNNEMGEGEPVGSIGKQWVAKAVIAEGVMDFCNPKTISLGRTGWAARKEASQAVSCSRGKAVRPLRIRSRMKKDNQRRIKPRS